MRTSYTSYLRAINNSLIREGIHLPIEIKDDMSLPEIESVLSVLEPYCYFNDVLTLCDSAYAVELIGDCKAKLYTDTIKEEVMQRHQENFDEALRLLYADRDSPLNKKTDNASLQGYLSKYNKSANLDELATVVHADESSSSQYGDIFAVSKTNSQTYDDYGSDDADEFDYSDDTEEEVEDSETSSQVSTVEYDNYEESEESTSGVEYDNYDDDEEEFDYDDESSETSEGVSDEDKEEYDNYDAEESESHSGVSAIEGLPLEEEEDAEATAVPSEGDEDEDEDEDFNYDEDTESEDEEDFNYDEDTQSEVDDEEDFDYSEDEEDMYTEDSSVDDSLVFNTPTQTAPVKPIEKEDYEKTAEMIVGIVGHGSNLARKWANQLKSDPLEKK